MAIATYADLQTSITSWIKRADLSSQIPDFITLGEARIQREIRSRDMEQRATSVLDSTSAYITIPSDLLEIRSVFLTSGGVVRPLQYMAPDVLMLKFNNASNSGEPSYYTIVGSEMRFGPLPDSNYTVEIWYYKRLAALSSATNSLFTNNPDLYLYASLTAAMPFMKDDKRIPLWEAQYGMIRDQVNITDKKGRRGQAMTMVAA